MKNLTLLLVAFSAGCTTYNQEKVNDDNEQILIGKINWDGLSKTPYSDWFYPNYKNYVVDTLALSEINPAIQNTSIKLFLGTWCEDSQLQVPQFYKILDHLQYNLDNLYVVALEKSPTGKLTSPQGEEAELEITHVPTIIFLKKGVELGRITEYPSKTIEKDMVTIMK